MPRPETSHRKQKVVYWPAAETGNPSDYDDYGERLMGTRIELDVRLIRDNSGGGDAQGDPEGIDLSLTVDRDIPLGSTMWQGTLDDLPTDTSTLTDLYVVKTFDKTPDVKAKRFHRSVGLARLSNELPSLS